MQGRSWMAALTVACGLALSLVAGVRGDGNASPRPAPTSAPPTPAPAPRPVAPGRATTPPAGPAAPREQVRATVKPYVVILELRIAGLGPKGCDVEVKPAHPACKFRPVVEHVDSRGWASLQFKDVETESADRDCTFAIAIREPGHAVRTVHYGLQLRTDRNHEHVRTCYLSSPSRLARAEKEEAARRR